jgi:hypothetical protein
MRQHTEPDGGKELGPAPEGPAPELRPREMCLDRQCHWHLPDSDLTPRRTLNRIGLTDR